MLLVAPFAPGRGRDDLATRRHCVLPSDRRFSCINIGNAPVNLVRIATA